MDAFDVSELFRASDETPGVRSAWMAMHAVNSDSWGPSRRVRDLLCPVNHGLLTGAWEEVEYKKFWAFAANVPTSRALTRFTAW